MKLSIIIPAFNEEDRIVKTLENTLFYLKRQKYKGEVVVVSDGSTDRTKEVVEDFKSKERISLKFLEYHPNRGKGYAVRFGMSWILPSWPTLPGGPKWFAIGEVILEGKHHAVGEVAVVRNGEDFAPDSILIVLQPFPKVAGVGAAHRRGSGVGDNPSGALGAVAEDDIAVQVITVHQTGPLEGGEGGEAMRLVKFLRGLDDIVPHPLVGRVPWLVVEGRIDRSLRELSD